jgi:hypothetical protein
MHMRSNRSLFWGGLLIVLGAVWLVDNLGLGHFDLGTAIALWWPVIPIYFGVAGLATALSGRGGRRVMWGSLLVNGLFTALFVAWLGNLQDWWYVDLTLGWSLVPAVVLVFLGVSMLLGPATRVGARTYWAVMFGVRPRPVAWDDATAIAVMGGVNLDFSQAGLPEREVLIDAYALMGGVNIYVPEGVRVVAEWTGLMGGLQLFDRGAGSFADHRQFESGEGPVIRVRAQSIMGGINVKRA